MNEKQPNSKRNLDLAIVRIFGNSTNLLQIRVLMANTIVGQLLPSGAVKGGSALKLRYGNILRRVAIGVVYMQHKLKACQLL